MKDEKYNTDVTMNIIGTPIQVHNCDGLCQHEFCGNQTTHYFKVTINGVPLFISMCEKHMNDIEKCTDLIMQHQQQHFDRRV